ncbi:MAG TPA: RICIN domain-containing protein [Ktedonobacteraceae bacterium]|nr:RICIN domain-containing protein [Ktedonobacteraceae bacterium]
MRKRLFSLLGLAVFVAMALMPVTTFAATTTTAKSTTAAAKTHSPHIFKSRSSHSNQGAHNALAANATSSNNLSYNGGPVMSGTTNVYTIFWEPTGSSVSANYNSLIERYFGDIGSSSLYQMLSQYKDSQNNAPTGSQLAQSWVDTGTAYPETPLLDSDIQAEVTHAMQVNSWSADIHNIFFVFTANNESLCFDNSQSACTPDITSASNANPFCAYHDFFNTNTIYAVVPYIAKFDGCNPQPDPNTAGPNNNDADTTINAASHEQIEAATDPMLNAWFDFDGNEIADKCAGSFGPVNSQGADVMMNSHPYLLQEEWNNSFSSCALTSGVPNVYYQITNRNSGLVTDVSGASKSAGAHVIQWTNHTGINQQWLLVPDGPFYQIVNRNSGLVLDVDHGSTSAGAQVLQWTNHNGLNQQWELFPDGGFNIIVNVNSGLVLDVDHASKTAGANVLQFTFHNGANQQWGMKAVIPYYKITNHHSSLAMDVFGGGTNAGANIIQWPYHNGFNQQWALVPDGSLNGTPVYQILNLNSGLVVDVDHASTVAGARVLQWSNHNGVNQQWELSTDINSCLSGNFCQIKNVHSGLVLDISGGGTNQGANVIQQVSNSSSLSQQWTLTAVSN